MKRTLMWALLALTLLAAGCGDDDAESDDAPSASGLCAQSDPDCEDPGALDPGDNDATGATSSGMVVDAGLTVSEALAGNAEGTLAVKGFLVADPRSVRLCEALAESMPS